MATVDADHCWDALKNRTLQAADILQRVLTQDKGTDHSAFTESFSEYAELWQAIASEALECGLDGLCDVCTLFHAAALDDDLLEQGLSDAHGELLKKWQTLFIAYLEAPEKDETRNELVRYLQKSLWAEPLQDEDIEMLTGLLMSESMPTEEPLDALESNVEGGQPTSGDIDHWGTLKNRAVKAAEVLQRVLNQDKDTDHSAFTESFSEYAELWQAIANEALEYGLDGLCDVCTLFHASALDEGLLEQGLSDAHGELLKKWQTLFIAYLEAPEKDTTRNELVRVLQEPLWAEPLSNDDLGMLSESLLPEPGADETQAVTDDSDRNPDLETDQEDITADNQALNLATDEEEAPATVTSIAPDLIELIRTQFEPYAESIFVALESEYAKTLSPEKFSLAMLPQLDELEMLSKVSETLDLQGLQRVFEALRNNMEALCADKLMLERPQSQLLTSVMSGILRYMEDIENVARRTLLAEHFQNAHWPSPLSEDEVQALVALFGNVRLQSREEMIGAREIASADDVSLVIQDDVNPELLESLFNELPALTEEFTQAVQQLLQSGSIADVEKAQRIAHTLKGSGNLVGITGIATMTHNIEDIMEKVAAHGSVPQGVFDTLLIDCADCLEAMSDCVLGRGSAPENALSLLQQLMDLAYQIKAEGIPEEEEMIPLAKPTTEGFVASGAIPAVAKVQVSEKTVEASSESGSDSAETMTRISSSLVEDMLRMAGENNIVTGQIQQRLNETLEQNLSLREQNISLLNLIAELEQLIEEQGNASQESSSTALDEEFDPLEMDQYNELHTCANRLLETVTDASVTTTSVNAQLSELKDLLVVQERLQKENHELVLQTRMVPVQSIVSRLQRAIRQASRATGKKVHLHIIGTDTLIDRDILNSLIDSLLHLLRNAVDHGIESDEQRRAAGKPESGNITLEFSLQGNRIIVVCQDDGGGLDLPKIRAIAEQKNLISADQSLSEHALQRLVLKPGFSTRDSATQLSGRGIGMNAVHDQILKLKGELDIDSEFGSGSRITLTLPATLVSVRALLVHVGQQLMAISNRGLEQILYPGAGKLKMLGDDLAYQQGEKLYSAKRFETLINISAGENVMPESSLSAMLFRMETGEIKAILVDQVVDSRDLIVKNMGQYVPNINGIAGATILGDGSVTPVLDIPELLRASNTQTMTRQFGLDEQTNLTRRVHRHALIIDDSLSARRSLAQLLSDMDYDVSTAIDGIDAIEKMEKNIPDVILVDLEMPRMNGIELTSHVRSRADTRNIPVIMVTSRATDKHRRQAENAGVDAYLTKPFSENEIMDQIAKTARVVH